MSTSFRFDSAEYVADGYHFGDRGLGVLGSDIPATGENGGSFMANDLEPGDEVKEFRARISRWPTEGVFDPEEDGSFSYLGDADYAEYFLEVDGVQVDGPNLDGSTTILFGFGDTTLDALSGTYTLTGQTARLVAQRVLRAAQGTYALTGQAAGLKGLRKLLAGTGMYSLVGRDVALVKTGANALLAGVGIYALNGQDISLKVGRKVQAGHGTYVLTGQAVGLGNGVGMGCDSGAYALNGFDVAMPRTRVLKAASGAYALSGQSAQLRYVGNVSYARAPSGNGYPPNIPDTERPWTRLDTRR